MWTGREEELKSETKMGSGDGWTESVKTDMEIDRRREGEIGLAAKSCAGGGDVQTCSCRHAHANMLMQTCSCRYAHGAMGRRQAAL